MSNEERRYRIRRGLEKVLSKKDLFSCFVSDCGDQFLQWIEEEGEAEEIEHEVNPPDTLANLGMSQWDFL